MPRKPRKKTHGHQIEFRAGGRRYCKTFPTKQLAEDWKREILVKHAKQQLGQPTGETFGDVLTRFLKDRKPEIASTTYDSYLVYQERHLEPAFGSRVADEVTRDELKEWMSKLRENGMAASSVNRMLQVIRAAYNHALEGKRVVHNPAAKLKAPKGPKMREVRALTDDEIRLVLAACKTQRARALVYVGLNTGMRLGELMAMRWEWVDYQRKMIRVPASVEAGFVPKGKKERELPLFGDLALVLVQYLQATDPTNPGRGPVFSGVNWRRWAAAIRKRAAKIRAAEAGLKKDEVTERWREFAVPFRWHLLRHTFISRLVMDGISLRIVQAIAGHASIRTTEQYAHLAPDAYDTVMRRFPQGVVTVR